MKPQDELTSKFMSLIIDNQSTEQPLLNDPIFDILEEESRWHDVKVLDADSILQRRRFKPNDFEH